MGGLFGKGPQKVSSNAPVVSSLRMQTSASGRPIPLLYGKTRVAANLIWYGDFRCYEHRSRQAAGGKGGGGGGSTMETISYSYEVALQLGLCEGPVRGIGTVWVGKQIGDLAAWNFTAQLGTPDQQPFPYLLSRPDLVPQALGYRDTVCIGTGQLALGDDPSLPNMSFEVDSHHGISDTVRDANPADVLADLLTHPGHGLGVDAASLGDLAPLRQWCLAAGLLVSPAYTEQQQVRDMVSRLLQIASAGVYCSGGLLKLVPLADSPASQHGASYQPDLTPIYDLGDDDYLRGDDDDPVQCQRTPASDVCNAVRVKFTNRDKGYNEDMVEAKDADAIARYGIRLQELSLLEIADPAVARLVAQLVLQRQRVRHRYRFRLGWQYALLEPTDLVTLTDPALGLDRTLVRITEIDEDEDGTLSLQAEELVVGTVQASRYPSQASEGYAVNHNTAPGPANPPVIFEPPLALAGAPEIWLATSGSRPDWGGCDVWVSDDNASYRRLGRVTGPARHGVLATALPFGGGIDTNNPLQLDLSVSGGTLLPASQTSAEALESLCFVDGELLAYRDATLTGIGRYRLDYLIRGALGSPIAAHPTGSPFVRLDQTVARFGYDRQRLGQTLYIKLQSFNIYGSHSESLADAIVYPYRLKGAPLADVPGLVLEQPFTGRSCQLRWGAVDAAASYQVEVWAGTPQLLRRSVAVGDTRRFAYSWEDALADGGPWRQLTFRVRAISATGASSNWATLVASNPVPPALTGISVSPGYNSVFFACGQPADPDVAGIRIWLSPQAGFSPGDGTLVYDGPDYAVTLYQLQGAIPLQAGTSYYLRAAAYDAFGKQGLVVSSEYAVTPLSVAGGLKPGDIDSALLQAIDSSKLMGTLKDWQLEGISAAKIAGQLLDSQLAALNAAKLVGQLNDSQLAAINASKLIGQLQDAQLAALSVDKLLGKVQLNQLAADVQGPLGSAINTANQALTKANEAATATSVQQLQARLNTTDSTVASSLTRLGNVESTVAGKAAASDVTSLQARLNTGGDIRTALDGKAPQTSLEALANRVTSAETAVGGKAAASDVTSLQARLNSGGDIRSALDGKAAQTALDAAVGRISSAEATLAGKASASDLATLRADVRLQGRNMLDTSGWQPGQPLPATFSPNGSGAENLIQYAPGPFNERVPVWRCIADGGVDADGGWNHAYLPIDPAKSYRFSVWVKPVSGSGTVYLGTSPARVPGQNGTDWNPYFVIAGHADNGAPLQNGKWYLLVGFRLAAGYSGGQQGLSAIYDAASGSRVLTGNDWQSLPTDTSAGHRCYQYYATRGAEQWFAHPRMELIDGNEPPISLLLSGGANEAIQASSQRLSSVEASLAGKASASDVATLLARVGQTEAGIAAANQARADGDAANAQSINQVNARLAPGGDIHGSLTGKAAQSALEAAVGRIATAEATLAGKAAASSLDALSARVERRKPYRLITSGYGYDHRQPLPWQGLADENGTLRAGAARSYGVVRFGGDGNVSQTLHFDVYGAGEVSPHGGAAQMAAWLNALPAGTAVAVYSYDEPKANRLSAGLPEAIYRCGGSPAVFAAPDVKYRSIYVLLGRAGSGTGAGYEAYVGAVDNDPAAMLDVSFELQNGQFTAIGPAPGSQASAALNRLAGVEAQLPGLARAQELTQLSARLDGMDVTVAGKAAQGSLDASNSRLAAVEVLAAGKAAASTMDTLQARIGNAEASVSTLQAAQAGLDGRVSSKWGVMLGATTPDGRKTLAGVQAFNDGSSAQFVITADQLLVQASGTALNIAPNFEDLAAWQVSGAVRKTGAGGAAVAPSYLASGSGTDNMVTSARRYPIDPGKVYRLSAMLSAAAGNNRNIYLYVQFYDGAGNYIGSGATGWGGTKSGYTFGGVVSGDWSRQGGNFGPGTGRPLPANVKQCEIGVWFQYSGNGNSQVEQACQDLRLEEVIPGTLIRPGEITTAHLVAQAVTADKIAANQISSTHIIAGSITGDRIAANTLTGDKVQAGSLNANHIDTRNLTIKDAAGNLIFGAGQNLDVGRITGLGTLATASSVGVNQISGLGALATANGVAASQVSGLGPLASKAQVAASDMAVGSLSAITANMGTVTAGNLSIQSDGAGGWGKLQSGSKWWYDGQNGWVLAREPGGGSLLEFQGGSTVLRMSSWGDCLLRFGDKIEMRGDGYVKVRRIAVAEPDIVASGTQAVGNSWWLGEYYGWSTGSGDNREYYSGYRSRTQVILIDTGINVSVSWHTAASDIYAATATISSGQSMNGGGTGYGEASVVIGDGLSSGGGGCIDNRVYIKYTYEHVGEPILISAVAWKLVRI